MLKVVQTQDMKTVHGSQSLLLAPHVFGLLFGSEGEGSMVLRNAGTYLQDYMASHFRAPSFSHLLINTS
jgi:hypothetical protein